jgi:hypothetical protein
MYCPQLEKKVVSGRNLTKYIGVVEETNPYGTIELRILGKNKKSNALRPIKK